MVLETYRSGAGKLRVRVSMAGVSFQQVCKSYPAKGEVVRAVDDLTFHVPLTIDVVIPFDQTYSKFDLDTSCRRSPRRS